MDLFQIIDFLLKPLNTLILFCVLSLSAILAQLFILKFWKKTKGIVLRSQLDKKGNLYRPVIEYSYRQNGKRYTGKSGWSPSSYTGFRKLVQKKLRRYPPAKPTEVLVDPIFPWFSVLPRDVNPFHWALVLVCLLSGFFITVLLYN